MTTPTHVVSNLVVFIGLLNIQALEANYTDLFLILSSNLIDLDHLFSRPIYHPKRNPFVTHLLHKKWLFIALISLAFIFIRPVMFLGIGLILHLILDYLCVRREKI